MCWQVLIQLNAFLEKIGEIYSFKKSHSQHENTISIEPSVNKVMETIMVGEYDPSTKDPLDNVTDKDGLMELFDQFSSLMSTMSD